MPANGDSTIPIGLRETTIENFRGISDLHLELLDPQGGASDIIVLAGPNGSGKTTVLEACLIGIGRSDLILGTSGALAARIDASENPKIVARLHRFNQEFRSEYRGSDGVLRWHNETTGQDSGPGLVECLYFSSWRAPKLVFSVPITAGRHGERPADTEANRVWLVKQDLVNAKAHAAMYADQSHAGNGSQYEENVRKLNDVWELFYPGKRQAFAVEPVGAEPDEGFNLFLTGSGGRVPVDAMSSGQLELFALFGSLLRAKFEHGLVVIDEPELHMDPQWHALILRALRKFLPRAQLIVATQSPKIYESVYSFQRYLLVPDDDPRARAWGAEVAAGAGT